jgi:POTRA domain-containing FtsQ-type protein
MLLAGSVLQLVAGGSTFALGRIDQPSLHWTSADAVSASIGLPLGSNLFQVRTGPVAARLAALPAVASARVSVALPDALVVSIDERVPILAWQIGVVDYIVDRDGVLFAAVDGPAAAAAKLPIVVDDRAASPSVFVVGSRLGAVDLDVATRLGALTPADVGSEATALQVRVTDAVGYTVDAGPGSWTALFGFYSPSLRSTDLIAGQVRLLRILLAGREATVQTVFLPDDRSGTYVPKASPR